MSMAMQRMYGRMTPVRGLELPSRQAERRHRYRGPDGAVKDKLKVLREFGVVDNRNEETVEQEMKKLLADNPEKDFDRLLDGYARKLISKKLGG